MCVHNVHAYTHTHITHINNKNKYLQPGLCVQGYKEEEEEKEKIKSQFSSMYVTEDIYSSLSCAAAKISLYLVTAVLTVRCYI